MSSDQTPSTPDWAETPRLTASGTGGIRQSGSGAALANTGVVGGNLTLNVTSVTEAFWTEAFPLTVFQPIDPLRRGPSGLLAAGSRVVRFTGRAKELASLTTWRDGRSDLSVMLVHGPGGQGKTRVAAAFAERSAAAGWAVSQARHHTDPRPPASAEAQATGGHGLLVVVDYAERWPRTDLERLFQSPFLHQGCPARVLLLARPADYWWKSLANPLFKLNATVREMSLGPLADTVAERRIAFTAARDRFAEVLGATEIAELRPAGSFADDAYSLALTLHMAALVAVDAHVRSAEAPADPAELSAYLLDREYDHWHTMRENGRISLPATMMGRMVGLATLTRPLRTTEAAKVVAAVDLASSPADAQPLLIDHATCYPPSTSGTALEPLFPDRFGEDLLARLLPATRADPPGHADWWAAELPARLLLPADDGTSPAPAPAALAVLVETGRRFEHVRRDYLFPLLHENPQLIMEAGGAALITLAEYATPNLLEELDSYLPERHRHIELDTGMAVLTRRLTEYGLATTSDDMTRGVLYVKLGIRASNAGLYQEAAAAEQEAVAVYRRLADANAARYEPDLATSLNNAGVSLAEIGQPQEALAAIQEAISIRRKLADAAPAAYLPDLAAALNNLGSTQAHLGNNGEAFDITEESVALYRQLARANPQTYEPDLARSLNNLGRDLSRLGELNDALDARWEAVTIRRRLAESNPTAYLPGLAASLHSLGRDLSRVERNEDALGVTQEATEIRRKLAETAPDAHEAQLAESLNSLSARLMRLRRYEEALNVVNEAVDIQQKLAEVNPTVHLSGLAGSWHSLGICRTQLGDYDGAVAAVRKAVDLRRKLAASTPAAHEPDLARSLYSLGVGLRQHGQPENALAATQEAIELFRELASTGLAEFEGGLARTLHSRSISLSQLGRFAEAVTAVQEVVTIRRRLATTGSTVVLASLKDSLHNLRIYLWRLGRNAEALDATREVVEIQRRLVSEDSNTTEADLALSLHDFAGDLSQLGQHGEALDVAREAVEICRRLVVADPNEYEPALADSLTRLGIELTKLGRHRDALAPTREGLEIRRPLADSDSTIAKANLSISSHLLSWQLSWLGEHEQAVAAAREAVDIRRQLAAADPNKYEPELVASLIRLYTDLAKINEHEQAVIALREVVDIRQRLGSADPDLHEPELALSLNDLGFHLSNWETSTKRSRPTSGPSRSVGGSWRPTLPSTAPIWPIPYTGSASI